MTYSGDLRLENRQFHVMAVVAGGLTVGFGVLLLPVFPASLRLDVSLAGLVVTGGLVTIGGFARACLGSPTYRRPWLLLASAGVAAVAGNVWSGVSGADPVTSPSLVTDICFALALALSVLGLVAFPGAQRRGPELWVMFLDGLVAGGALLVIVSKLVYSQLLVPGEGTGGAERVLSLSFPVFDVMVATTALLLLLRALPGQRMILGLLAAGFWLYAVSDLTFSARVSRGSFEFGSVMDLGWIWGYLAIGAAVWVPAHPRGDRRDLAGSGLSNAISTTVVFGILLVAAVVQIGFGRGPADPRGAQAVTWIVLVLAAGVRQVLLTADNAALRRTLERQVEERTADLHRSVRQNEILLGSVADGIVGVDADGCVSFLNESAARSLGYSLAQLRGRRPAEVIVAPHKDGAARHAAYIDHAVSRGVVSTSADDEYVRADGSRFPVEVTAAPLIDDHELRGAVVVFRDVTERREVDRMKDEFLSVVSHELRTPLTSIRGSLGLLEDGGLGALPARADSMVRVALESSERLTRLIDDLLDLERLESGTRTVELVRLRTADLLASAVQQIDGMAHTSGVQVAVGRAEGTVLADEDQILQTLLNLAGNSIKFSQPGSLVELEAVCDGSQVLFAVRDQGKGIPQDKLSKVFERFEQVDSSDTRHKGGTGLGLAISQGIVERHGGTIWAESQIGVGTTISFTLPSVGAVDGPATNPAAS